MNGLPGLGGPAAGPPLDQVLSGLIQSPVAISAPQLYSGGTPNTSMQIANATTSPKMQAPGGGPAMQMQPNPMPQAPTTPMAPQSSGPQASKYTFQQSALAPQLAGLGAQQFTPPIRPTGFGM